MRIAIVLSAAAIAPSGGVRVQGLMWRDGLKGLGHTVDLINFWDVNDWEKYDSIIILGSGQMFKALASTLVRYPVKIFSAPIIDPLESKWLFKFKVQGGPLRKLSWLLFRNKDYQGIQNLHRILVRSEFERNYVQDAFGIPNSRIDIVPLSFRHLPGDANEITKEDFCFHASRLRAPGKNVSRLIKAAKKYQFPLVLAGYLHGQEDRQWLDHEINGAKNIRYVGMLTDEELSDYYRRAKVFALPSLEEGVGMVALEAAAFGCEIVLTNIGAPKEYYHGRAKLVNPKSIDEIGRSIIHCMRDGFSQPALSGYVREKYSLESCSKLLESALER